MKTKTIVIITVILLCLASGIYLYQTNKGVATVTEAIEQSGRNVYGVLYQENTSNGAVVFFKSKLLDNSYSLNAGYVKKGLLGWKWVWGGGCSEGYKQYFPDVSGTPFPLFYGGITDGEINNIEIRDKEQNYIQTAKIEGIGSDRIWFAFLNKSDGPDFNIVYLSDKGEVIKSESINVTETSHAETHKVTD